MLQLPKDYLSYISAGGCDSGFTSGDPGYFQLWAPDEVDGLNRDYRAQEFAPGFVGFGSDGGGEMLAFDAAGAVYMIPFIGGGSKDAKKIASNWSEVAARISTDDEVQR